ncbi:PP2C family protein-serine/threonine phosphatase [Minwuia sp.]|uniref:PP2C family protein-serine/threonine phosphatase n=1 Tax=Minwuia sp. TaxID=2493630 RepID=UPI003A8E52A0
MPSGSLAAEKSSATAIAGNVLQFSGFSIKGVRRKANGDRYLNLTAPPLLVVADGISSSDAGAESAEACINALASGSNVLVESKNRERALRQLLDDVNGKLLSRSLSMPNTERRRGGCCVAGILVDWPQHRVIVFHAGDSAVFLVTDGKLKRLTKDHASAGNARSMRKARIRSAIGLVPSPEISISAVPLDRSLSLLIASDGCDDVLLEALSQRGFDENSCDPEIEALVSGLSPQDDATAILATVSPEA